MKKQREELSQQLQVLHRDGAELEKMEKRIKVLTQLTKELKTDLQKLGAEEPVPVPAS